MLIRNTRPLGERIAQDHHVILIAGRLIAVAAPIRRQGTIDPPEPCRSPRIGPACLGSILEHRMKLRLHRTVIGHAVSYVVLLRGRPYQVIDHRENRQEEDEAGHHLEPPLLVRLARRPIDIEADQRDDQHPHVPTEVGPRVPSQHDMSVAGDLLHHVTRDDPEPQIDHDDNGKPYFLAGNQLHGVFREPTSPGPRS